MTYKSPSGVESTGAEAAEHWSDAFGFAVTRTTGAFAIGGSALEFGTEYRERDSDRSTAYVVEVEMSGGQITSMSERRAEP